MFIVFEGIDGSGKTTMANLLTKYLQSQKKEVLFTKAPSNGRIGTLVRDATKQGQSFHVESMAMLFAADINELIKNEIVPVLEKGGTVICDRFFYSLMAYQGVNNDMVNLIENLIMQFKNLPNASPDYVFFMDTEPEICIERLLSTRNEISIYEEISTMVKTRERFLKILAPLPSDKLFILKPECEEKDSLSKTLEQIKRILYN